MNIRLYLVLVLLFSQLHCFSQKPFHKKYKHQPISQMLFELARHFEVNSVILGLDDHVASYSFLTCQLKDCYKQIYLGRRVKMMVGSSFSAYTNLENYSGNWDATKRKLEERFKGREYPKLTLSYNKAPIFLVLSRILELLDNPLQLSNRLDQTITIHVKEANAFEVLAYIMEFYHLRFLKDFGKTVIVPESAVRPVSIHK